MIGIIGAMTVEVDTLNRSMADAVFEEFLGIKFCKGRIHNKDVVTAVCGIGKVAAAMCASAMILKYAPDAIINSGVGGALSSKLDVGDIVIADDLVQHDMDTSGLGDPLGLISGINVIEIKTDDRIKRMLEEVICEAGYNYLLGRIATGDQFISSNDKKATIINNFSADACEMEGGSIAQVCYTAGVPFCVIRAISDNADGDADVSYGEFVGKAAEKAIHIVDEFIKRF